MWNSWAELVSNGEITDDETMVALIDAEMERELNQSRRPGVSMRITTRYDEVTQGWMPGDLGWPTFLNHVEPRGANDLPSDFDYDAAVSRWHEREVECKFCGNIISVMQVSAHMEEKHYSKVLKPLNDNKIVDEEEEADVIEEVNENEMERPSHGIYDRSSDLAEKIMPGTSARKNRGNYYMKLYREKTDGNNQAVKQKLVAKMKKRIM